MVQIDIIPVLNVRVANEQLLIYQKNYPKRKIMNVSMTPVEYPGGWFMTITYEIER